MEHYVSPPISISTIEAGESVHCKDAWRVFQELYGKNTFDGSILAGMVFVAPPP